MDIVWNCFSPGALQNYLVYISADKYTELFSGIQKLVYGNMNEY